MISISVITYIIISMYNNFVKPSSEAKEKKERRKPVSENFVPKRLACSYDPPIISMIVVM